MGAGAITRAQVEASGVIQTLREQLSGSTRTEQHLRAQLEQLSASARTLEEQVDARAAELQDKQQLNVRAPQVE